MPLDEDQQSEKPAPPLRILHLEDSANDSLLIQRHLARNGFSFELKRVDTQEDFLKALEEFDPELVLSDNSMPTFDSASALTLLRDRNTELPFILVSGTVGEERAVEMLKRGATDYVLKDRLPKLVPAVQRALAERESRIAHRQSQQALRQSIVRFTQLANAMPQIVWTARADGEIDYINHRWYELAGNGDESRESKNWFRALHPEDADACAQSYRNAINTGKTFEVEARFKSRRTGEYRWHLCRAVPIVGAGDAIERWFGTATDIDDRKRAEQQLLQNIYYDPLTGLPNRVLFESRLEQALRKVKRDQKLQCAVIFLDVDRFKLINDSMGHGIGDQFLTQLGKRLARLVRPEDTVARFGGDEFAILLEDIEHLRHVTRVTDRILESFVEPFRIESLDVVASVSLGIALGGAEVQDGALLVRDADTAMYRAKAQGRGRYEVFDAAMHAHSVELLELERDLRRALERKEFCLHYQPIVALDSGAIVGCEALLRWSHPKRGFISPDRFIPLAEETGLIIPLGEWILETACAQARKWREENGAELELAVNFSGRQFRQPGIGTTIVNALAKSKLDPRRLKLELTESVLMEFAEHTIGTLNDIKAHGVEISIDDFGTGYSSLAYLKRFPCSSLKIDRSFICDVTSNADDAAIALAIISMAHSLRLKVVAEGIETQAQYDFLKQHGCDYGQGYLMSRPLPPEGFVELLQKPR